MLDSQKIMRKESKYITTKKYQFMKEGIKGEII